MTRIRTFLFSLKGKAIITGTFFIIIFMGVAVYIILSTEWSYYFKDREDLARVLAETAGINFTNAILGTGNIDYYIADLLNKENNILTISIFDNSGMIMAHSNLFEHNKFYKDAKEVIAHQSTFVREIKDKERGPVLEAITPLMAGERRLATLRIEFSMKDLYDRLTLRAERMFLRTIIAISGSIFLMYLGINAILKPIRRLSKAMDSIDYGRYETSSDIPRNDEIGVIERSFSSMIKRLKEADIKWENTFNSITDPISIHYLDYRLAKVNSALTLRCHTTPEDLVGRYCWEVYHNSNHKCPECPHERTLKTGKPSISEKEYHPLGGTFLSSTFPYFNEDGKMIGTIHIAKEITFEKKLQEKLIHSEKMAAMGQIAAGIAHEINNPLNSITGYASYLLEQRDETPGKEELDKILKAAVRCKESVRKFLNLARDIPKKIESIDIKEVIENVLSMCHHNIFSQKIKVIKGIIEPDLWVKADKIQIEEAFINIVLNACQAMKDGGELTIKAYEEGGSVKVEIADTGPGIPEEDIDKIFDPFFTTKEPGQGTGLGLAVSRTIIKNNGGAIYCHSVLGEGAAFIITLPGDKYAL
ncbi:MAG: ATP-binding protein [Deltaproteobacteria bacterium]